MKKKLLAMTLILILIVTGCGSGSAAQDPDPNQVKVTDQEKGEKGTDKIVGVADPKDVSGNAGNQEVKDTEEPDGSESTAQASDSKKDTASPEKSDSSTKTEKPGSASSDANKGSSTDSSGAGSSETTGKPGSTNSDKGAGTSSGSGSSEASGGQTCKHKWVEETKTVNHEATGHYETQVIKEAWDEPVYEYRDICNKCGTDVTDDETGAIHYAFYCDGSYSNKRVQTGTISHAAETKQVWVVDKAAWTETVGTGKYKCSLCGKAK